MFFQTMDDSHIPLLPSGRMAGRKTYHSPMRERQAEETRRAIAEAARRLLLERGYAGTTIEAIAEAAGVAPQTVTAAFGNKRGVLAQVLTQRAHDEEYERLKRAARQGNGRDRLRQVARITRRIYEATRGDFSLLRTAAGVAPELADLVSSIEEQKRQRQAVIAEELAERGELRRGVSAREAGDLIFALTGHDLYHTLVIGRGWSPARYERWLAELLVSSVLA